MARVRVDDSLTPAAAHDRSAAAAPAEERWLATILQQLSAGTWDWDVLGRHMDIGAEWLAALGYRADDIEPSPSALFALVHDDDRPGLERALRTHLDGRSETCEYVVRFRTKTRGFVLRRERCQVVARTESGAPLRVVGLATAVTESAGSVLAPTQSAERSRAVGRDVHMAESRERAALARELHDEFGQLLTAAKISAAWIRTHAAADGSASDALRDKAANLCEVIDMALHGVRHVASQLRPPALDQLGLPRALQGLASQIERHAEFECQVDIDEATRAAVFGPAEGAAVYRIAQELLTNVARHAGATQVRVTLTTTGDLVRLVVADDGRGFPPDASERGGWGLKGIRERTELFGGHVEIDQLGSQGATVRVTLPRGAGA